MFTVLQFKIIMHHKYTNLLNSGFLQGIVVLSLFICLCGCKKLLDVDPPSTSTNSGVVFSSDATAVGAVTGIYTKISTEGIASGISSMSLFPSLSADELTVYDALNNETVLAYYNNSLTPSNTGTQTNFWTSLYGYIYSANSAIEGLNGSSGITPRIKKQLLGEVRFVRAFCYFYLVNLFGGVPLVTSTDYKINSVIGRSDKQEIYELMISDLNEAVTLLDDKYYQEASLTASNERIVPNKWTAMALLARTYLYINKWDSAEICASQVIEQKTIYDTVSLSDVFTVNNKECIWQLQSISNVITNTADARLFVLPESGPGPGNYVYLTPQFAGSFEQGDLRRQNWMDSVLADNHIYYYPAKYKVNLASTPLKERTVVFRLAEQYLIRSEARMHQAKYESAAEDLNVIRARAGLGPFNSSNSDLLLDAIVRERRSEFFTEWGHRWLDLKRLGFATQVLQPIKGMNWQKTDELYPIPYSDILRNPNLANSQNPGY